MRTPVRKRAAKGERRRSGSMQVSPFSPQGETATAAVVLRAVSFPRYQKRRMLVCFGGSFVFRKRETFLFEKYKEAHHVQESRYGDELR